MRGARRFAIAFWGAGLLFGADLASAQEAPPSTSNTPATDAIGPPQLQNFSLQGNPTRREDQPTQRTPAAETPARREPSTTAVMPGSTARTKAPTAAEEAPLAAPRQTTARRSPAAVAPQIQQLTPAPSATIAPAPQVPAAAPAPVAFPPAAPAPAQKFWLLPWLLVVAALAIGGAFLLWRSRSRPQLAGGPGLDLFEGPQRAPDPAAVPFPTAQPDPVPIPAPVPPPAAAPMGIVSTALRPWIDIAIQPKRCILTDQDVTIEFDLELFNSGSAPARNIAIEGMIVNAGPTQDDDLGTFFAKPPVQGNRIELIAPIHRINIPTQLVVPREFVVPVEMGGGEMFVPLLAFNAIYAVGSREGRTSTTFLVGRDGNGGKLAPFRLGLGPRVFRSLGARQLPTGIRR